MTSDFGVYLPGGKTGILLLHDIGGTAAELRPLATALARAGYTVSCPQIGSPATAAHSGAGAWLAEASEALAKIKSRCDHAVVLGSAYGAMLAAQLARSEPSVVTAIVMIEPRAWLPQLAGRLPRALGGAVRQSWVARAMLMLQRNKNSATSNPAAFGISSAEGSPSKLDAAALCDVAVLLDSVHEALPSIMQPVLIVNRHASRQADLDSASLLQRSLGGRVESVGVDDAEGAIGGQRILEGTADRTIRFVSSMLDEIETRRGNELRKQKLAGRTSAA